jgi:hypothetical protein
MKRGTTAALNVATGEILAAHSKRRRRTEFLGLMNRLVKAYPARELHEILDNLNTHKKERSMAEAASQGDIPFHPRLMAQSGRNLVLGTAAAIALRRILHRRPRTA